jgi:hypothetical protein
MVDSELDERTRFTEQHKLNNTKSIKAFKRVDVLSEDPKERAVPCLSRSRSRKTIRNTLNASMHSANTFLGSKRNTRDFAKADNYTIRTFAKKSNLPGQGSSKQIIKPSAKLIKSSQTLYYNLGATKPLH